MIVTAEQIRQSLDLHFRRCSTLDWRQFLGHKERLTCLECERLTAVAGPLERELVATP